MKLSNLRFAAEGAIAAHSGKGPDDCPYEGQAARSRWIAANVRVQQKILVDYMKSKGVKPINGFDREALIRQMRKDLSWD
jgi:hypothetical protein